MALRIINLSKNFGEKKIFDGLSYEFSDKGLYALVGDSGIGKTTLLRLISGLDKKYKGEIFGGGFANVSYSFQEYRLFPSLTAIGNVVEASGASYESAEEMLLYFGFTKEDMKLFPSELSGGMKQRASLARAILKKCPILLLDEPTKELDSDLKAKLYNLISEESKSRLVIFVTHSNEDIEALSPTVIRI